MRRALMVPAAALAMATLLSGCENSAIRNWTNPTKQRLVENGYTVSVIKNDGWYASWFSPDAPIATVPPLILLKPAQIKAIEKVSGCRALYNATSAQPAFLEATVDCTARPAS